MTKLTKIADVPAPVSADRDSAVILSMIDKMVANPDMPVERLEQMFELHRRVKADAARTSYFAALADMQPALPIIAKLGKGHGTQRYARWEDIVSKINPILTHHGFAVSFRVKDEGQRVLVTCVLSHRDGHAEETGFPFPYDGSGSKNAIQAVGSAIQYGKRYTACALLNIVGGDEEDDGARSDQSSLLTEDQVDTLFDLIAESGANLGQFLVVAKVGGDTPSSVAAIKERLSMIRAAEFPRLKAMLLKKRDAQ